MKKRLVVLLSIFILAFAGIASAASGNEMMGQWDLYLTGKAVSNDGQIFDVNGTVSFAIDTVEVQTGGTVVIPTTYPAPIIMHGTGVSFAGDVTFIIDQGAKFLDIVVFIKNPSLLERGQDVAINCRMFIIDPAAYIPGTFSGYHTQTEPGSGYARPIATYGGTAYLNRPGGKG